MDISIIASFTHADTHWIITSPTKAVICTKPHTNFIWVLEFIPKVFSSLLSRDQLSTLNNNRGTKVIYSRRIDNCSGACYIQGT